ncbi:putative permease [Streptococcus sp. DD11]|nr:AI-2E family transporter [Streptococcus sp. DD11]KXT85734.1 putative permease [Streptococcus sp. DD11]
MKKINESYKLIVFAALALALVLYIGRIWSGLQSLAAVFFPIILGGALAFVFNVPMKKLENLLTKCRVPQKLHRPLALLLEVLILLLILAGIVSIVVPTLTTAVNQLSSTVGKVAPQVAKWLQQSGLLSSSQLQDLTKQLQNSDIVNRAISLLGSLTGNISAVFGNFFSVIMSIFLMFAILASKEHLQRITGRLMRVLLPEKAVRKLSYVGTVIVETYDRFLMGQLIEAVIVGLLVFAAYSLTGLPYAALTGVLTGVLSFIPYIGPFSACALGAIFIFTDSPWKALLSIVVFQAVQLIEGNVIYPRVVGQSVGLPTLFTLAAALIGGNLFGLVGMIFFTPVFAVIYRLLREFVEEKEEGKAEKGKSEIGD